MVLNNSQVSHCIYFSFAPYLLLSASNITNNTFSAYAIYPKLCGYKEHKITNTKKQKQKKGAKKKRRSQTKINTARTLAGHAPIKRKISAHIQAAPHVSVALKESPNLHNISAYRHLNKLLANRKNMCRSITSKVQVMFANDDDNADDDDVAARYVGECHLNIRNIHIAHAREVCVCVCMCALRSRFRGSSVLTSKVQHTARMYCKLWMGQRNQCSACC